MSNWTHVAGIIRVDDIRVFSTGEEINWDKIFGKECHFDSDESIWKDYCNNPELYLPSGSEGTLTKSVWVNPKLNDVAAYTISVFGDLRDHDNPKEIIKWFKEVIKKHELWVRNAVITAENEWYGTETWTYYEEERWT
jgi:hypothetical protein